MHISINQSSLPPSLPSPSLLPPFSLPSPSSLRLSLPAPPGLYDEHRHGEGGQGERARAAMTRDELAPVRLQC